MSVAASERVFVAGMSGSGKTEFLLRRFLPRSPRLLIVDQTGEWTSAEKKRDGDLVAFGFVETLERLREVAPRPSWRIVAYLENEEVEQLSTEVLLPPRMLQGGYAASVGGMGILLDEVDMLVPFANASVAMRSMWRRSRHAGLSVYSATQRPGSVSKEVTSQSRWIALLRLFEPNDVLYLERQIGREVIQRFLPLLSRKEHSVFLWDNQQRIGYLFDANGVMIGTSRNTQQELSL